MEISMVFFHLGIPCRSAETCMIENAAICELSHKMSKKYCLVFFDIVCRHSTSAKLVIPRVYS